MNNNKRNVNRGHGASQNNVSMGEVRAPNYIALYFSVFFATLVLFTAIAVVGWMVITHQIQGGKETVIEDEDETEIYIDTSADDDTTPSQEETSSTEKSVTLTEEDVNGGTLMLLNPSHSCDTIDESDIKSIYELKNYSYQVAGTSLSLKEECIAKLNEMMSDFKSYTGHSDVNVIAAYRSFDEQMQIYSSYVCTYGLAEAEKDVAKGGCSDHNTGYGFDLSVYTSDGLSYELDYDDSYGWITENCCKYGFVLRYAKDKTDYTTLYEQWHFRYVGVPHAYYMYKNNLCLEEYLTLLEGYQYGNSVLEFADDSGGNWQVFTVKPNNSGIYSFECENDNYTVSDTNCGYIVVTVEK